MISYVSQDIAGHTFIASGNIGIVRMDDAGF